MKTRLNTPLDDITSSMLHNLWTTQEKLQREQTHCFVLCASFNFFHHSTTNFVGWGAEINIRGSGNLKRESSPNRLWKSMLLLTPPSAYPLKHKQPKNGRNSSKVIGNVIMKALNVSVNVIGEMTALRKMSQVKGLVRVSIQMRRGWK